MITDVWFWGDPRELQLLHEAGAELSAWGASPGSLSFFGLRWSELENRRSVLEKIPLWGLPTFMSPSAEVLRDNEHLISMVYPRAEGIPYRRLCMAYDRTYLLSTWQLLRTNIGNWLVGGAHRPSGFQAEDESYFVLQREKGEKQYHIKNWHQSQWIGGLCLLGFDPDRQPHHGAGILSLHFLCHPPCWVWGWHEGYKPPAGKVRESASFGICAGRCKKRAIPFGWQPCKPRVEPSLIAGANHRIARCFPFWDGVLERPHFPPFAENKAPFGLPPRQSEWRTLRVPSGCGAYPKKCRRAAEVVTAYSSLRQVAMRWLSHAGFGDVARILHRIRYHVWSASGVVVPWMCFKHLVFVNNGPRCFPTAWRS